MELVVSEKNDPAINLALEEFLFNKTDMEYALFYVNAPSVIIGCNQVWENEINVDFCYGNAIPVYRRISGGGAVYHDYGNLNYCFIMNKKGNKTDLNAEFLKPIIVSLTTFGCQPVVGQRKDLWLPDGFKFSGTASHVTANRVLHHGTLLYETDLDKLNGALASENKNAEVKGISSVPSPVKNIRTYCIENHLSVRTPSDFFNKMIEEVKFVTGITHTITPDEDMMKGVELLANEKYRDESWNKRK
ncbi:MAG: lipoate--protein ligase family protein [Paludibacter sp.]|nr:lipoate--protein ligase family protein [Paludibacter sp.]MDD4198856.1 lipoate--protein ligase family protein [Paludibacter sp.]MDD4428382.1 lipoate--protein ligase family protein [Paludibacter sp.]